MAYKMCVFLQNETELIPCYTKDYMLMGSACLYINV